MRRIRGEYVILSKDRRNTFLQAAGNGDGPFLLEYREDDASTGGRPITRNLRDGEVAQFTSYLHGTADWKLAHDWTPLSKQGGCLQATGSIAALSLAALIFAQQPLIRQPP